MGETFLAAIWRFASPKAITRLDTWQIIVGSLVPLFYWLRGLPMPSDALTYYCSLLGLGALGTVLIRVIIAPYFIWKEQQAKISELSAKLDEPRQLQLRIAAENVAKLKLTLVEMIGTMRSAAFTYGIGRPDYDAIKEKFADYLRTAERFRKQIEQLSHERDLHTKCMDFAQLCDLIIVEDCKGEIDEDSRAKMNSLSIGLLENLHGKT